MNRLMQCLSANLVQDFRLCLDGVQREKGRADLLGDTTSFTFLDVRLPDLRG